MIDNKEINYRDVMLFYIFNASHVVTKNNREINLFDEKVTMPNTTQYEMDSWEK